MSEIDTQRIPLRLAAWGETQADVETAIYHAGLGSWRAAWEFVDIERSTASRCPVDLMDGGAVATGSGRRWAYAVYPMPRAADG